MGQKLTKQDVRDAVQHAFEQTKAVTGGKNADYIPYLANVPSDLFGIAVCLPDGEIIAAGDTEYKFGIESVSKVPTAILTMNQYSPEEVLTKIGADATGLPFNSIMAILLEKDHPSTPLVNAGAIAACSMIKPIGKPDAKWEAIQGFIEGLCGSSVEVIDELYILIAITKEGKAQAITSGAFIKKYKLSSSSSVQSALKGLLEKDFVTQEQGTYQIYDQFLGIWLKENY